MLNTHPFLPPALGTCTKIHSTNLIDCSGHYPSLQYTTLRSRGMWLPEVRHSGYLWRNNNLAGPTVRSQLEFKSLWSCLSGLNVKRTPYLRPKVRQILELEGDANSSLWIQMVTFSHTYERYNHELLSNAKQYEKYYDRPHCGSQILTSGSKPSLGFMICWAYGPCNSFGWTMYLSFL